jgi:hypothetical protein
MCQISCRRCQRGSRSELPLMSSALTLPSGKRSLNQPRRDHTTEPESRTRLSLRPSGLVAKISPFASSCRRLMRALPRRTLVSSRTQSIIQTAHIAPRQSTGNGRYRITIVPASSAAAPDISTSFRSPGLGTSSVLNTANDMRDFCIEGNLSTQQIADQLRVR